MVNGNTPQNTTIFGDVRSTFLRSLRRSPPKKGNVCSCTNLSPKCFHTTIEAYLSCNAEGWQQQGISLDWTWFPGERSQVHTPPCRQHFYLSWSNDMQYSDHSPRTVVGEWACQEVLQQNNNKIWLPYILESNPHPFYSFRGLKNQMRIRSRADYSRGHELDFGKMIQPLCVP